MTVGGETVDVDLETGLGITGIAPKCAKIHKAIYDSQDCSIIKHVTDPDVIAVSCTGEDMIPMIDDFAQIAGVDVKNRPWIDGDTDACAKDIAKAMDSRNAILIQATVPSSPAIPMGICRRWRSLWIRAARP